MKSITLLGGAITIKTLETIEDMSLAAERIAGMSREEAFRCCYGDCQKPGEIYLGAKHEYFLCLTCADAPRFKRHKVRVLGRDLYPWSHK